MIRFRPGLVLAVTGGGPGLEEVLAEVEGKEEMAINYPLLTGPVKEGDRVLLNTTAVDKGLGTGGYHFVAAVEGNNVSDPKVEGHIMKLRYTPLQVKVLSVEEEEHPARGLYRSVRELAGLPVVVGTLHSMLAPVAAAFKAVAGPGARLFYLMTDGAALPIWLSRLVRQLKEKGLVDGTITCGHAFGGDHEAINVYSGLLWAKAAGADLAVVAMGPGIVGSAAEFGHTGLEQGEIINAVNILGGAAIGIPRISFADPRERHRGVSHHTRTALGKVALTPCVVTLPALAGEKKALVQSQLAGSGILGRHQLVEVDTSSLPGIMEHFGLEVTSMGRSMGQDPEFFHAAGAAGIYAARLVQAGADKLSDTAVSAGISQSQNEIAHTAGEEYAISGQE